MHGTALPVNLGKTPLFPYILLILIFVFSGLIGHDPWKADEAYIFGVIQHMLTSSDWVVPMLAGEPFMEKPPLYYWVACAFTYVFSGWLPLHDSARLASGFFMLLTCSVAGLTARIWWGTGMSRYVILILITCLGTIEQSHMMMPDLALLTGFSVSALGFAMIRSRPTAGGVLLGLGVGTGFLAKGLIAPAVIVSTALLLPICFTEWRTHTYKKALVIAFIVGLPWCVIWPVALYMRSPALFMEWIWINNFGRFFGFSVPLLRTEHAPWFWSKTIPWFTFPGLPLALWALWRKRRTALTEPPVQYCLVAFGVLMLVLALSSSGRCVYAWPLIVPIAILAGSEISTLPKKIDRIWIMGSLGLFGLLSLIIWVGWGLMMLKGTPPSWPRLLYYLPVTFIPHFNAPCVVAATLITFGAFMVLKMLWRHPARGLTTWATGITLTWSLLMTLWLPWIDFAKSYRSVFASMPIPDNSICIASIGLGEGERAMLRYITGHNPVRREVSPDAPCTTLLVQKEVALGEPDIDLKIWSIIWKGARPGITNERFWLYQMRNKGRS